MSDTRMTPRGEVVRQGVGRLLFLALVFAVGCTETAVVAIGGTPTELTITVTMLDTGEPATSTTNLALNVGDGAVLSATALNALGQPVRTAAVTWASTDPGVVSVDANGTVSAVGPGSAEVFATSNDIFATLIVSVTAPPQPPG